MKWHACSRLLSIGERARRLFVLIAIIAILSAAWPARAVFAQCGLDPTFGTGGVVNVSYEFDGDTYTLVGLQVGADGKIVALLNTGVNQHFARYNHDRSLDT